MHLHVDRAVHLAAIRDPCGTDALDFIDTDEAFPIYHFCFRVEPADFAAILERIRAAGIPFRSDVHGPVDMQVHPEYGNVYWNVPDGHMWEMLTVSYARPPA